MSGEAHGFSTGCGLPFVGRHRQLAALETALQKAGRGTATAVYVHGPSGIGKSALVQRFLDRDAEARGRRCAAWPLLRVRIGAIQRPRRRHRQPQPAVERPATIASRSAVSARPGGVVTALSRHAAGRRGSVRAPARAGEHRACRSCGSEPSRRCANCCHVSRPANHSSSTSTTFTGRTPTVRCCSRNCCARRTHLPS